MKRMLTTIIALAVASLHAAYNEIDTGFPMTGPTDFIAGAGVTNVYTGLISGTGPAIIKGGGTVAFANSANDYAGGTRVENAVFRLDADGCAGTGAITSAVNSAHIFVNCSTVSNDIFIAEHAGTSSSLKPGAYPGNSQYMLFPMCDVTFEGNVEFARYGRYYDFFDDSAAYLPTVTYKKGIKVGNNYLHLWIKGKMIFGGRFVVSDYANRSLLGTMSSGQGTIEFQASSNYLYQANLRNEDIVLKAEDAFALTWLHYENGDGSCGKMYLTGLQSILGISWDSTSTANENSSGQCITSTDPATLRITGRDMSLLSKMSVNNKLVNKTAIFGKTTLLMDVDHTYTEQGFYQDFSVRRSTTTGDLIISNGDFRVSGTASFPNVPNIYVGVGGSFTNASTKASAFAGCKNLTVLGKMACTGDATPFSYGTMALTLGSEAEFSLPAGATMTVCALKVGDVSYTEGTFGDGGTPVAQIRQGTVVVRSHDRYVDCNTTDTVNDGSKAHPYKTIKAATENALSGDVIHVAPGTYGEAEGSQTVGSTGASRVVVPADVTLESTGGADVTFIVGAAATGDQIDNETYKTGTNGVRCVYAKSGAVVRGFTLAGGRVIGASEANGRGRGPAFYSETARATTLEDCIVSNNAAYMGTLYAAVVRRCRVVGNVGLRIGNVSAPAGTSCSWYGCIIDYNRGDGTVQWPYAFENCTIGANNLTAAGDENPQVIHMYGFHSYAVNSVILKGRFYMGGSATLCCTNCLIVDDVYFSESLRSLSYNTILTNTASMQMDSEYRPILGKFVGIDRGDATYSSDALGDTDIYDTPRILNGAIDIGAVEYDWRPTFAQALGRRFTMTYASPSVTTNATGGLVVADGEVAGTVGIAGTYELALTMTGGSLAVYVGGAVVASATAGDQSVRFSVPDTATEVRIVFTPDAENPGSAVLKKLASMRGFVLTYW